MADTKRSFYTVVYEDTQDKPKIVATCKGDAMAERDLLAGRMEQDGYDVPEILREG